MNAKLFFQKLFVYIVCFLLLTVVLGETSSVAGELTPESDIFTLVVPSTGQTLYKVGLGYRLDAASYPHAFVHHDVAVAKDGSFVVTWVFNAGDPFSTTNPKDSYILPVYARRFNADGSPWTNIIEVCEEFSPENKVWNTSSRVACDEDGNFIVCWARLKHDDSHLNTKQIYARLFDIEGDPLSNEFPVNDEISYREPEAASVAMNSDGNFVITWNDVYNGVFDNFLEGKDLIYMMRFDADGAPLNTEPISVNTIYETVYPFNGILSRPSVAINAYGGFAISWATSYITFVTPAYKFGEVTYQMFRQFDSNGSPKGLAKKVSVVRYNSFFPSLQRRKDSLASPVIAMNDSGNFAVSYYRHRYDDPDSTTTSSDHDAGYRFYNSRGVARGLGKKMGVFMRSDSLVNAMDNNGNLIMGWFGCDGTTKCENNEAIYLMQTTTGFAASKSIEQVVENVAYDPTGDVPDISYPALDASADGRIVVVWHDNEKLLGCIYSIR